MNVDGHEQYAEPPIVKQLKDILRKTIDTLYMITQRNHRFLTWHHFYMVMVNKHQL